MPFELSERSKVSCRLHGSFTAFPNQGLKKSRTNPCPGRSKESAISLNKKFGSTRTGIEIRKLRK